MAQIRRWHIYPQAADLVAHGARSILRSADEAVAMHGQFTICLAGGTTPLQIYSRLAQTTSDWSKWHVYFGDERCYAAGDAERNDTAAFNALLNQVPIPKTQIWPIPAEIGARAGAARYLDDIARVSQFDLVLLGLGEDGHTASLFPGMWDPRETSDVVPVEGAPKPPPERISLSASCLSRARQVLFFVAGAAKRNAIAAWRRGDLIPASGVVPAVGVDILVDAAAWPDGPV
jgi:6-phosphogluconolactonase